LWCKLPIYRRKLAYGILRGKYTPFIVFEPPKTKIMNKILVIDDDNDIITLLKRFLTKHGYEVDAAFTGARGEKLIESFKPDLVMCDYRLDDMDGGTLLTRIKEMNPSLPVIIITGYSDLRTAVKVVRLGAFDYITKPFIPDEILFIIKQALAQKDSPDSQVKTAKAKSGNVYPYLFSNSAFSKHLQSQISLVAPTDYSVIIYGESGAGKEGIARLIHDKSKRAGKPFVAMDCGAISKDLAGSELFGHEKGSFTGAVSQKIGHFEMANGGTLFLDEVSNLPYDTQTLLLRVLQEKVLRRIGGNKETPIDVRIIVASNERLTESIMQNRFREDLYHRLNEFGIELLPLRKRKEDIIFFANHFLSETSKELDKNLAGFDPEVEDIFLNYPWPGNVRELKNVIKRAVLLNSGDRVGVKSLPFEILNYSKLEFNVPENDNSQPNNETSSYHQSSVSDTGTSAEISKTMLKKAALDAEYEMIMVTLTKTNFKKSKAAEMLGIDRKTLYNKMKQMRIADK